MRLRFLIIWLSPNICYVQSVARLTFSGFHKVLVVRLCLNKVLFKYCYTQVAVAPTGWGSVGLGFCQPVGLTLERREGFPIFSAGVLFVV